MTFGTWWRNKTSDFIEDTLLGGSQTNWCRYRTRDGRCHLPHGLNIGASVTAGWPVWQITDRGPCDKTWGQQLGCFEGGTEFLTYDGPRTLKETVGTTQLLLTRGGQWVDAEIRSFGEQPLYRVVLSRRGVQKVLYATAEHRWFIKGKKPTGRTERGDYWRERVTFSPGDDERGSAKWHRLSDVDPDRQVGTCLICGEESELRAKSGSNGKWGCAEAHRHGGRVSHVPIEGRRGLQVGDRLTSQLPRTHLYRWTPNPTGIAAGIVFGDGSRECNDDRLRGNACYVMLYGSKDAQLLRYFDGCPQSEVDHSDDSHRQVGGVRVTGLPGFFKDRPSLDESAEYLYGWLAGYFAADGAVADDGGTPTLSCADRETLEFVQAVCNRLTIATYAIIGKERQGCYGSGVIHDANIERHGVCQMEEPRMLYSMSFVASTLVPEFFLIAEHRERFLARKAAYDRLTWTVEAIEPTDRCEEVFCAVVPETQSFVLVDHILTGNCPLSEAGPDLGKAPHPEPWEQGGQRNGPIEAKLSGYFPPHEPGALAKVRGELVALSWVEGQRVWLADGTSVDASDVTYPVWHPTAGLVR